MKKVLVSILFLFALLPTFAQKGERVESIKIAFLSGKMNLDSKTAEKFWPIYNQYESELRAVVQEKRNAKNDANKSIDDILDTEQKALDIKRKYATQFLKVISNDQLAKMYQAEKEFRKMILRRSER